MRAAVDHLIRGGQLLARGIPATGVLVETLLDRGAEVTWPKPRRGRAVSGRASRRRSGYREIWLLRLRARLARAHSDEAAYRDYEIATVTWRKRLATKGISSGPRRCHDGGGLGFVGRAELSFRQTPSLTTRARCPS